MEKRGGAITPSVVWFVSGIGMWLVFEEDQVLYVAHEIFFSVGCVELDAWWMMTHTCMRDF